MQTSTIKGLLEGSLEPEEFTKRIANELDEFKKPTERGSSIPIYVTVDTEVYVDEPAIRRLCNLYIADDLSQSALEYIADAIELSSSIDCSSEYVREVVFVMGDPVANGPFTKDDAKEVIVRLDSE